MPQHEALVCFFSSRRRHTRCLSDWSSDVCSSDLFAQLRMGATLDAKTLILSQVEVEDVEFHQGHAIEVALYDFERLPMTADINQQSAPRKPWPVAHGYNRQIEA